MRELQAVNHRCDVKEAVRSLNIPATTPARRVPESMLFSNPRSGPSNALHDEVQDEHIQYLLDLQEMFFM
jgi:hypothetical protein